MRSIRELLAGDLAEGNQTERLYEGPLDRQMALANTNEPLGIAIKRMRSSGSHNDRRKLVMALDVATCASHPGAMAINSVDRFILANIAIDEWINAACPECKGKAFTVIEGYGRFDCNVCNVSGRRRYTTKERQQKFGETKLTADHNRFIGQVHGEIAHHDMTSDEATKVGLGR